MTSFSKLDWSQIGNQLLQVSVFQGSMETHSVKEKSIITEAKRLIRYAVIKTRHLDTLQEAGPRKGAPHMEAGPLSDKLPNRTRPRRQSRPALVSL